MTIFNNSELRKKIESVPARTQNDGRVYRSSPRPRKNPLKELLNC